MLDMAVETQTKIAMSAVYSAIDRVMDEYEMRELEGDPHFRIARSDPFWQNLGYVLRLLDGQRPKL